MATDITESKSFSRFKKNTLPDRAFNRHPGADVRAEVFGFRCVIDREPITLPQNHAVPDFAEGDGHARFEFFWWFGGERADDAHFHPAWRRMNNARCGELPNGRHSRGFLVVRNVIRSGRFDDSMSSDMNIARQQRHAGIRALAHVEQVHDQLRPFAPMIFMLPMITQIILHS